MQITQPKLQSKDQLIRNQTRSNERILNNKINTIALPIFTIYSLANIPLVSAGISEFAFCFETCLNETASMIACAIMCATLDWI
jgi:hypothetical protein